MTVAGACHFSKPAWHKLGNCVRIIAQVIDSTGGEHVWAGVWLYRRVEAVT